LQKTFTQPLVVQKHEKHNVITAIPCYNTAQFIYNIVIKAKEYSDEVVVIDDGSSDGTFESAQSAGARIIRHKVNLGYGEAIKSSFRYAQKRKADILVIIDGDGQHDPDEIPLLLNPVLKEHVDLTIGSRFLAHSKTMPSYRRFGILLITTLWNLGARIRVSDSQSGFRAYNMKKFMTMSFNENDMGISIEIIEKARHLNASIREVPVSCTYDHTRIDSNALSHGIKVAFTVLKIRVMRFLTSIAK